MFDILSRERTYDHSLHAMFHVLCLWEIRSKASSLANARKRMGKSPPRYHRRNIFVSRGATGNYSTGNNRSGGLDGGINYGVGLNERAYYRPLFKTRSRGEIMRKCRRDRKEVAKTYDIILEYELRWQFLCETRRAVLLKSKFPHLFQRFFRWNFSEFLIFILNFLFNILQN